jgi:hypothetical protein
MIHAPLLALALSFPSSPPPAGVTPVTKDDVCPWCQNDPERLKILRAVSHGPFPVAKTTSTELPEQLPGNDWVFLETEHLRLSSNLPPQALSRKDYKKVERYFIELNELIPDIPKKPRKLDPWLRIHLMAIRAEEFYERFQKVLQVTDDDFSASRMNETEYMGGGKYLGEKDKFELVFHSRRKTHRRFTLDQIGFDVTDALRWHFSPQHKMMASIPAEDGDLVSDTWLFPHTAHLLSHLFLCAYKDFAYDPPIWIDEGLAHVMEREIEAISTTIDGDEGTGPHRGDRLDWRGKDVQLVKRKKAPSVAAMWRLNSFSDMNLDMHATAWSMARFLLTKYPDEFARFLGGIKGQLDERGIPTGADLPGLQRKLFREIWDWSPADFDAAWQAWVLENA